MRLAPAYGAALFGLARRQRYERRRSARKRCRCDALECAQRRSDVPRRARLFVERARRREERLEGRAFARRTGLGKGEVQAHGVEHFLERDALGAIDAFEFGERAGKGVRAGQTFAVERHAFAADRLEKCGARTRGNDQRACVGVREAGVRRKSQPPGVGVAQSLGVAHGIANEGNQSRRRHDDVSIAGGVYFG